MNNLSDNELVALCNDGDAADAQRAFETLYARHKDYVVRIALRFGADHAGALDVLQETFLYLLRKFPPPGDGITLSAKLTTLLYPVAKNLTLTQTAKASRYSGDDIDPDSLEANDGNGNDVEGLFAGLTAERREVLMLRFVDGLSLEEIATVLDIPKGTVKSRLHSSVQQLRNSPKTKDFFD
ncbi:MAG: sigma-70 family RNA polymerase sigma factor [Pseudomonadota bacterium]